MPQSSVVVDGAGSVLEKFVLDGTVVDSTSLSPVTNVKGPLTTGEEAQALYMFRRGRGRRGTTLYLAGSGVHNSGSSRTMRCSTQDVGCSEKTQRWEL